MRHLMMIMLLALGGPTENGSRVPKVGDAHLVIRFGECRIELNGPTAAIVTSPSCGSGSIEGDGLSGIAIQ